MDPPGNTITSEPITIDVHLPPGGPLSGMAADVRAGLDQALQGALSALLLRRARLGAVRGRSPSCPSTTPPARERAILERDAAGICATAGNPTTLIELGSGSASKTRVLLDAMDKAGSLEAYAPVDISEQITRDTAEAVASEYGITVHGLVCDFERDLERMPLSGPRVIAFLGGTIGNFEPAQRASFLARVANLLGPEDHFLLGTDLVKGREVLEAAYNDSAGRNRRVQQERAQRAQPRARRLLRPRRVLARRLVGCSVASGSTSASCYCRPTR